MLLSTLSKNSNAAVLLGRILSPQSSRIDVRVPAWFFKSMFNATLLKSFLSTYKAPDGQVFRGRPTGGFGIRESYESNRYWLPDQTSANNGTPMAPLLLLRKTLHQGTMDFTREERRLRPLTTIKRITELYTDLIGKELLEPIDAAAIAKLLLQASRRQPPPTRDALARYLDLFGAHYIGKLMPPHASASLFLLSYFDDCRLYDTAGKFWSWIVRQDDNYVDTRVYAAAVHSMIRLDQPLHVCDALVEEALRRCSHFEVKCLLRPGAMFPLSYQKLANFHIDHHLCHAFFYARLLRQDVYTAYLALDTAFRVWPSNIRSIFLKDVIKSRPVHEAYQVYILYCQNGASVRNKELTMLLDNIARSAIPGGDLAFNLALASAVFDALEIGSKMSTITLDPRHLDCLIRVILSLLPRRNLIDSEIYTVTDTLVARLLSELCGWFYLQGVRPSCSPYNVAISLGGELRNINILEWATKGMREASVSPDAVFFVCLMTAAGKLKDPDTVMTAWKHVLETLGNEPREIDWAAFGWAAKGAGILMQYQKQLRHFLAKGCISAKSAKPGIYYLKSEPKTGPSTFSGEVDGERQLQAFLQEKSTLMRQPRSTDKGKPKDILKLRKSIWQWPIGAPEEWQQSLYNDMSSKADSPLPNGSPFLPTTAKIRSPTGVEFRKLRYNSWKTINNLLMQVGVSKARTERSTTDSDAFAEMGRKTGVHYMDGSVRPDHRPWLLEHFSDIKDESTKRYSEEEWREKILDLRGVNLDSYKLEQKTERAQDRELK